MRRYFILAALLFISCFTTAQKKTITVPYEETHYGEGATQTITISTDESLRKVYTTEIRDQYNVLKVKGTFKKSLAGEWEVVKYELRPKQTRNGEKTVTLTFNREGKWTSMVVDEWSGKSVYNRTPDGEMKQEGRDDEHPLYSRTPVKTIEQKFMEKFLWLDKLEEKDTPSPEPSNISSESFSIPTTLCRGKANLFAGPALLMGDVGPDKETLLGGHVFASYNINAHISAGLDFSTHFKKIETQKISRSFLLARGQYTFGNTENCDRVVMPEVHIVFGLGLESIRYTFNGNTTKSSGSGLAFGAGAGLGFKLSDKINLNLSADYLGIKFKNSSDLNKNIRVSAGANIDLWTTRVQRIKF